MNPDKTMRVTDEFSISDMLQLATETGRRLVKYVLSDVNEPFYRLLPYWISDIKGRDPKWNPGWIISITTIKQEEKKWTAPQK